MARARLVFEDEAVERRPGGWWLYTRAGKPICERPTRARAITDGREFVAKYGTPERAAETRKLERRAFVASLFDEGEDHAE